MKIPDRSTVCDNEDLMVERWIRLYLRDEAADNVVPKPEQSIMIGVIWLNVSGFVDRPFACAWVGKVETSIITRSSPSASPRKRSRRLLPVRISGRHRLCWLNVVVAVCTQ